MFGCIVGIPLAEEDWGCIGIITPAKPKVLTLNGMSLSDFKSHNEAMKVADEIVLQNQKEMGHSNAAREHSNPILVKVF